MIDVTGTLARLAPLAFVACGIALGLLVVGFVALVGWLVAGLVGL